MQAKSPHISISIKHPPPHGHHHHAGGRTLPSNQSASISLGQYLGLRPSIALVSSRSGTSLMSSDNFGGLAGMSSLAAPVPYSCEKRGEKGECGWGTHLYIASSKIPGRL